MINFINALGLESTVKGFDSAVARSKNAVHGPLKESIFFLHVFKCGGTSINQSIKSCYLTWNVRKDCCLANLSANAAYETAQKIPDFPSDASADYRMWKFRENLLMYYMYQGDIKYAPGYYISGHFCFSETAYQNFADKYAFVTVLRDPVKRWISAYLFNRYKKREHHKIHLDIADYLETERAAKTRGYYVKLLTGANSQEDYTSEQAIARAKENLHKFSVVGCLEYYDDFTKRFEERFDRKLVIRKLNPSPKSVTYQKSIITEEIEEKIRELCKPDIEIYQYAVDNFVKYGK